MVNNNNKYFDTRYKGQLLSSYSSSHSKPGFPCGRQAKTQKGLKTWKMWCHCGTLSPYPTRWMILITTVPCVSSPGLRSDPKKRAWTILKSCFLVIHRVGGGGVSSSSCAHAHSHTHLLDSAGFYVHHVSSVKVSMVRMWCESLESRVVWDFLCAGYASCNFGGWIMFSLREWTSAGFPHDAHNSCVFFAAAFNKCACILMKPPVLLH